MADQVFSVNSGFYDAINYDRTYSAEDMNKPYKRLVANGVFATPQGTPSTDLQVTAATGMNITVAAGEGMFSDKWFQSPAALTITVPSNTNIVPRIDSVIAQVDNRQSGRVANIVYRTGTPASTPSAPAINQTTNVVEYRIANIYVSASATSISQANITDLRGSEACPWVTSLIQQVDTSTLFAQYSAAYREFYNEATADFEAYFATKQEDWNEFFEQLTQELTAQMSLVMLTSSYTSVASVTNIPINIASFNHATDVIYVFINGLMAAEGVKWEFNENGTSIDLTNAISAGQTVYFLVFKSVVSGDIESITSMIEILDAKISAALADSDWTALTLANSSAYDANSTPAVRKVGKNVYLRGAIKGVTATGTVIATLPLAYIPTMNTYFTTMAVTSGAGSAVCQFKIDTSTGEISLDAKSGTIDAADRVAIDFNFIVG
jgi:hypothetical protein